MGQQQQADRRAATAPPATTGRGKGTKAGRGSGSSSGSHGRDGEAQDLRGEGARRRRVLPHRRIRYAPHPFGPALAQTLADALAPIGNGDAGSRAVAIPYVVASGTPFGSVWVPGGLISRG